MLQPLLSVIIPVYNAQKDLDNCLDSILSQEVEDLEIILVDDGSRDNSLKICRDRAELDPRIRVFSQPNAGPGSARNRGLDEAKGEYLYFADSDDVLVQGALKALLQSAQADTLVIGRFNYCFPNGKLIKCGLLTKDATLNRDQFLAEYSKRPGAYYYSALWNKLYPHALIKNNGLRFDESLMWGEDCLFNIQVNKHIRFAHVISDFVYAYKRTSSGLTSRTLFHVFESISVKNKLFRALKDLYITTGTFDRLRLALWLYYFSITVYN